MSRSLSLAFYLATKARRSHGEAGKALTINDLPYQAERSGVASQARPKGPLVWFHTGRDPRASAVREFCHRLRSERDDLTILLTTSADIRMESKDYLISQLTPDEALPAIRGFLAHWRPDLAIWTEPDMRPALVAETDRADIPLMLVDAGTAAPDPQSWRWWRGISGALLSRFQHVVTGDAETAAGLRKMGADPATLEIKGFLQEGTPALSCNEAERTRLANRIGARPVWLAAHVSQGERAAVITAHRQALRRTHRLLLILVPQDLSTGPDWAHDLAVEGQSVALRSAGQTPDAQTQIYVADTRDEMGLWYRLAPFSYLGQSLEPNGGINPFEAAALGSAILHGMHVDVYSPTYVRLAAVRGARPVRDAQSLGDAVEALLSPDVAAALAFEAWKVVSSGAEVTDRMMELILTSLDTHETT